MNAATIRTIFLGFKKASTHVATNPDGRGESVKVDGLDAPVEGQRRHRKELRRAAFDARRLVAFAVACNLRIDGKVLMMR
jgi:hypothetical protein